MSDAVICRSVCSFFGASLWTWVEHGFVRDTRDLDCYLCGTIFVVIHWQAFCAPCGTNTEALFEQLGGDRQRDGPHGWTGPGSQGSLLSTGHVAGLKTALGWNWNSMVKFLEHGVLLGIHPDLLICVLEVGGIDMNWQQTIRLAWNPLTERKCYGMKPCDRQNALHPFCFVSITFWGVQSGFWVWVPVPSGPLAGSSPRPVWWSSREGVRHREQEVHFKSSGHSGKKSCCAEVCLDWKKAVKEGPGTVLVVFGRRTTPNTLRLGLYQVYPILLYVTILGRLCKTCKR